ncbi:DNA-directed RNA polymerase subunit alpha [bacterium]|nr:DNA-directed RNA polymerase subunit alpha [bacterium]
MAILAFQKPDNVNVLSLDDKKGVFEVRPLEPGYSVTIGNALRRILLSSLEGFAITSVKIEGVDHEFASIKGVIEDVTNIVLNLKQIRFKQQIKNVDHEEIHLTISGKDVFKAGDLDNALNGFQVLNPEFEICHMEPSVKLSMDFTIDKGRGWVPAEENKMPNAPIGTIAIDSIHTPIKNVHYETENFRVEQKTDYEKLVLTILTDGSIAPKEALKEAAKILIQHFMLFSDEKISLDESKAVAEEDDFDEDDLHMRQLLNTKLTDMELSVRALNCLKAAEVDTLGELVAFPKSDLLKFRNFGKKSLTELENLVKSKNLDFGMNVAKYKLNKSEKDEE